MLNVKIIFKEFQNILKLNIFVCCQAQNLKIENLRAYFSKILNPWTRTSIGSLDLLVQIANFVECFRSFEKLKWEFRTFRIRRIKYISGQESETSVKWPTGDTKDPRGKFSQVKVVLGVSGVEQGKQIFGNFGVPVLRLHHVVVRTQPRTETAPRGQGTEQTVYIY